MPVVQISRIQHRMGTSGELPSALTDGELGFTSDTGELFIGAASLAKVAGRKSYPYQNIKILTEFDVQHTITGDTYYHGPIETMVIPNNNTPAQMVLFRQNLNASAQFGRYDFSLTSSQGAIVGSLEVVYRGSSVNRTVAGTTTGNTSLDSFSFLTTLVGEDIQLSVAWNPTTFGAQDYLLSISGREWSAIAPV